MEAPDSVFSSRASSQNCTAVRSVFSLRPGRAVSRLALSTKLESRAEPVLGTFAFYVKGRRASPPKETSTKQIETQARKLRQTSSTKPTRSQKHGLADVPTTEDSQSKENLPDFSVLLVEDNLVNRGSRPSRSSPWALTVT